jgi:hypothetical protein
MAGGDEEAKSSGTPLEEPLCREEASSTGKTKGWPKTAFAEETPLTSLGATRRPRRTQGS